MAPQAPIETPAMARPSRDAMVRVLPVHVLDQVLDDEILVLRVRIGDAVHVPAVADRRRHDDHVARGQCTKPAARRERRVVLTAAMQQIHDRIPLPRRAIARRKQNRRDLLASERCTWHPDDGGRSNVTRRGRGLTNDWEARPRAQHRGNDGDSPHAPYLRPGLPPRLVISIRLTAIQ